MSEVTTTTDAVSTEPVMETETPTQETEAKIEPPKSLKEKFKLKVDGEEFEEEIDFADKEGLRKRFQMAHAARKRMDEAAAEKKKAYELAKLLNDDPEALLAKLGPKGKEAAEKFLLKQIQESMLSPEEKQRREEMSELEALRKEKKEREEKAKADELAAHEAKYAEQYQKTIIDALEAVKLPKSPVAVKRMADLLSKSIDRGYELDAQDLAAEYKEQVRAELLALTGDADGDQLVEIFGQDIAKKIRTSDVRRLTEKQSKLMNESKKFNDEAPPQNPKQTRPMSMDEWREMINKRLAT
jgi:hypothetical protein